MINLGIPGGSKLSKIDKYNSKGELAKSPLIIDDRKKFNIGSIYVNNDGELAEIIDYNGAFKVTINFLRDNSKKVVRMDHLKTGNFTNNNLYVGRIFNCPSRDSVYKIIEVGPVESVVQFLDSSNYIMKASNTSILSKKLQNPYRINSYGGYLGIGDQKYDERIVSIWRFILLRSINENKPYSNIKGYEDVLLDERWLEYQSFAKWYNEESKNLNPNFQYNIDKDFLQIGLHPKIYTPQYCILIPKELNLAIHNIYLHYGNLPVGVREFKNRNGELYYRAFYSGFENKKYIDYKFRTPEQAFEAFREYKLRYIESLLDYFYKNGAISTENYIALSFVDILPYRN